MPRLWEPSSSSYRPRYAPRRRPTSSPNEATVFGVICAACAWALMWVGVIHLGGLQGGRLYGALALSLVPLLGAMGWAWVVFRREEAAMLRTPVPPATAFTRGGARREARALIGEIMSVAEHSVEILGLADRLRVELTRLMTHPQARRHLTSLLEFAWQTADGTSDALRPRAVALALEVESRRALLDGAALQRRRTDETPDTR